MTLGNHRAFKSLAEVKGWGMEDIVMEAEVVTVSLRPTRKVYLPAVMRKAGGDYPPAPAGP